MRALLLLCFGLFCGSLIAQGTGDPPATALSFSRTTSIPLNKVQLHDRALEALAATFGREPGAKVLLTDRESGDHRSGRSDEFPFGDVDGSRGNHGHHRLFHPCSSECRRIAGGRIGFSAYGEPQHGTWWHKRWETDADDDHAQTTAGLGRSNVVRVHAELRELATKRINSLLQSMEAYIRANMEP
jgi:hypothetical protein